MGKQAIRDFLTRLQTDSALAKKVSEIKASSQVITDLASQYGYEFSPDEFEAAFPNRPAKPDLHEDRELTEEELELVAGGGWSGYWVWNTKTRTWEWVWVWSR